MLSPFDWLRLSCTGSELLATMRLIAQSAEFPRTEELGPPRTALSSPCMRCWVYPRHTHKRTSRYCSTCKEILARAWQLKGISPRVILLWGFVNKLPRQLQDHSAAQGIAPMGVYIHDENHFLLALHYRDLKGWLREVMLYYGDELQGFIQIFPTTGSATPTMGELLTRIIHHDSRFPMDRLRVRFFSKVSQIFYPHAYDKMGVLTFDILEFLSMLEMASIFRAMLRPEEQRLLYKLLSAEDVGNVQFYWGRVMGYFDQGVRDMLNAWKVRYWSEAQANLFYKLIEYVELYQSDHADSLSDSLEG
ncbi:MAG: hypothetical protein N2508_15010 [Anaerolineae bacterium]|nr:hypothetical protein [Anaerolineae bacterium]